MTRKEFLVLTFTLVGSGAAAAACSDSNNNNDASLTGLGGTTGGGRGGGSGGGTAGTSGGGTSGGTAGTSGGGTGGGNACNNPLPEVQAASDHTHMVTVPASTLDATTAQTFMTTAVLGHMHSITLEPANLATIKGGGSAMVTSTSAGTPAHTHVFTISCT